MKKLTASQQKVTEDDGQRSYYYFYRCYNNLNAICADQPPPEDQEAMKMDVPCTCRKVTSVKAKVSCFALT